jgi:predicted benzoate:H+ symporter BenE
MQAVSAGLLAGFVGFASSFAVVLQGLTAMGASPAQAASGLMALSVAMGLAGMLLSLRLRLPVSVAWSTPGAALLAASAAPAGGFAEAVGAFLACGALLTLAGLWKPLGRAVAAIPAPLANASSRASSSPSASRRCARWPSSRPRGLPSCWPGRWWRGSTGCSRSRRRWPSRPA